MHIVALTGPAAQPDPASLETIIAAGVVVVLIAVLFVALLAIVRLALVR
jgi:hypothetical protein